MIFKTFNNDIDKWTAKIGIFGKSFNELGTAINNAFEASINNIDNFDENIGFWETLKNNLAPKTENGDSWLRNSLGEIISAENINSYIAELDLTSAKDKLADIFDWNELVKNGDKTWDEYFDTLRGGNEYIIDTIKNTDDLSKLTGDDLVKANQQARSSALAHNEALKQQTLGAKAGQIALKGLAIAGNMLAGILISKGIEAIAKGIDELVHSAENCKERVDELMSSYKSALDSANSNAKRIEEIADSYERLSNGVNRFGQNVSLTTKEYEEYNDIVNEIADMFPEMVKGYTDEGNAILSLKGNVEELRDAYKEAQTEAYNLLINGENANGDDILEQWNNLHKTSNWDKFLDLGAADVGGDISMADALEQLKEFSKMSMETYKEIDRIISSGSHSELESLTDAESMVGRSSYLFKALGLDQDMTQEEFDAARNKAQSLIQTFEAEIQSALSDIHSLANAYLVTNENYSEFDEECKNAASIIVNNISQDVAEGFKDSDDVGSYVNNIVNQINEHPEVKEALVGLFSISDELENMSIKNAKAIVDQYITAIAEILGEDELQLKIAFGFEDLDSLSRDYKNITRNAARIASGTLDNTYMSHQEFWSYKSILDEIDSFAEKYSINTQEEIDAFDSALERANYDIHKAFEYYLDQSLGGDSVAFDPTVFSETIDKLSSLQSLYESFKEESEDGIYIPIDITDIEALDDSLKSLSGFREFEEILSSSSSDISDVERAFNQLATEYIHVSGALRGLNTDNRDMIVSQLELKGLYNASSIITSELAEAYEQAAIAGVDLSNATFDEINQLIQSKKVTDDSAEAMIEYFLAKVQAGLATIDTTTDVQQLINEYEQIGLNCELLREYLSLKNQKQREGSTFGLGAGNYQPVGWTPTTNTSNNDFLDDETYEFGASGDKDKKSKSGSSSNDDPWKDAFDKELATLQHNKEMEYITEAEYYAQLQILNEKYFAGKEKYLDDYRKYEEENYDGLKDVYKKYIEAQIDLLNVQLDNATISYEDYLSKMVDLLNSFYSEGKISAEDYFGYLDDLYSKQLDIRDRVKNTVVNYIKDQIDELEEQKEAIESTYQLQIDALESEKEALEKANEARQDAIDLQKKLYELNHAQNQRDNFVYTSDKGFVYRPDESNIRDAQNDLDDAEYENKIKEIENQISILEQTMESATDGIDDQIDALNEYAEQWESVSDIYDNAINEIYTAELLGQSWEEEVMGMRQEILKTFTEDYCALQQAQADAAVQAANKIVEANNNIANSQMTSPTTIANSASDVGSSKTSSTGNIPSDNNSKEEPPKRQVTGKYYIYDNNGVRRYPQGFNTSGEAWSYLTSKVGTYDAREHYKVLLKYAKGGVVGKYKHPLDAIANAVGEDHLIAAKEGERVLTRKQNENLEKLVNIPDYIIPLKQGDSPLLDKISLSSVLNNRNPFENIGINNIPNLGANRSSSPIINIQNPVFTCTGVTGEQVLKEIQGQFEGLFIDAYQKAMKR